MARRLAPLLPFVHDLAPQRDIGSLDERTRHGVSTAGVLPQCDTVFQIGRFGPGD
jgi:hypothetical protein